MSFIQRIRQALANLIDKSVLEQELQAVENDVRTKLNAFKEEVDNVVAEAGPAIQSGVDKAFEELLSLL